MTNEVIHSNADSHSTTRSKTNFSQTSKIPRSSKMQSISSESGEQLLKRALIRKRTQCQDNAIEIKPSKDSKKASISAEKGNDLLNVVRNGTEKLNIKENKCKSSTHSKLCFCSPTTHEGSFRCRLHRNIPAKKSSATEKKSNLRCSTSKRTHGMVEFKPQMSRFGRIASAEMAPHHDSLIQLSGVESV